MTPDLSARVAALEAREQARDVALIRFGNSLSECPESAAPNLAYAIERWCRSLPAAAPPQPAAAPDVIERVREAFKNTIESLELHSRTKPPHHPKSLLGEAREALRLLGARP